VNGRGLRGSTQSRSSADAASTACALKRTRTVPLPRTDSHGPVVLLPRLPTRKPWHYTAGRYRKQESSTRASCRNRPFRRASRKIRWLAADIYFALWACSILANSSNRRCGVPRTTSRVCCPGKQQTRLSWTDMPAGKDPPRGTSTRGEEAMLQLVNAVSSVKTKRQPHDKHAHVWRVIWPRDRLIPDGLTPTPGSRSAELADLGFCFHASAVGLRHGCRPETTEMETAGVLGAASRRPPLSQRLPAFELHCRLPVFMPLPSPLLRVSCLSCELTARRMDGCRAVTINQSARRCCPRQCRQQICIPEIVPHVPEDQPWKHIMQDSYHPATRGQANRGSRGGDGLV